MLPSTRTNLPQMYRATIFRKAIAPGRIRRVDRLKSKTAVRTIIDLSDHEAPQGVPVETMLLERLADDTNAPLTDRSSGESRDRQIIRVATGQIKPVMHDAMERSATFRNKKSMSFAPVTRHVGAMGQEMLDRQPTRRLSIMHLHGAASFAVKSPTGAPIASASPGMPW